MNRKSVICTLLIALMAAGLAACGGNTPDAYDYDLSEYVTVGEYTGLPYVKNTAEVTDEEVETEIQSRLQAAAAKTNVTEGTVEDGDTINVAYVGTIDGKEFEGGSTSSSDITIGTTSMIDGFIEGLVGQKIGDTVTLNLKFPDDYWNADVAGKDVTFEVTINSKKVTTVPELDEEFVKANSDVETVDEYKALVKEQLLSRKQDSLDSDTKSQLWSYIVDQSETLKYPEQELADAAASLVDLEQQYMSQAQAYGIEWEDYLSTFMGTDAEGWEKTKQDYAEYQVKSDMIMYAIARKEKITLTNKEYKARIAEILEDSGLTEETFQSYYGMTIEEYADQNGWYGSLLLDKVLDRVMELGEEVTQEEYDDIVAEREAAAGSGEEASDEGSDD